MKSRARTKTTSQVRSAGALGAGVWLVLLVCHARAEGPPVVRVDGLAALVGGNAPAAGVDVILRSDVELRARISLLGQDRERALSADLPAALLSATLMELVGEALIAREADRVQIAPPGQVEVQREKDRMTLMAGGSAWLQALTLHMGASASELDVIARRRALAAAFLSANLEGAMLITESEVEERYRVEQELYADADPAKVRELIRARLAKEALNRNIERWVRVLQARTPVRMFANFDPS